MLSCRRGCSLEGQAVVCCLCLASVPPTVESAREETLADAIRRLQLLPSNRLHHDGATVSGFVAGGATSGSQ